MSSLVVFAAVSSHFARGAYAALDFLETMTVDIAGADPSSVPQDGNGDVVVIMVTETATITVYEGGSPATDIGLPEAISTYAVEEDSGSSPTAEVRPPPVTTIDSAQSDPLEAIPTTAQDLQEVQTDFPAMNDPNGPVPPATTLEAVPEPTDVPIVDPTSTIDAPLIGKQTEPDATTSALELQIDSVTTETNSPMMADVSTTYELDQPAAPTTTLESVIAPGVTELLTIDATSTEKSSETSTQSPIDPAITGALIMDAPTTAAEVVAEQTTLGRLNTPQPTQAEDPGLEISSTTEVAHESAITEAPVLDDPATSTGFDATSTIESDLESLCCSSTEEPTHFWTSVLVTAVETFIFVKPDYTAAGSEPSNTPNPDIIDELPPPEVPERSIATSDPIVELPSTSFFAWFGNIFPSRSTTKRHQKRGELKSDVRIINGAKHVNNGPPDSAVILPAGKVARPNQVAPKPVVAHAPAANQQVIKAPNKNPSNKQIQAPLKQPQIPPVAQSGPAFQASPPKRLNQSPVKQPQVAPAVQADPDTRDTPPQKPIQAPLKQVAPASHPSSSSPEVIDQKQPGVVERPQRDSAVPLDKPRVAPNKDPKPQGQDSHESPNPGRAPIRQKLVIEAGPKNSDPKGVAAQKSTKKPQVRLVYVPKPKIQLFGRLRQNDKAKASKL